MVYFPLLSGYPLDLSWMVVRVILGAMPTTWPLWQLADSSMNMQ
jgi:hypothetical protein